MHICWLSARQQANSETHNRFSAYIWMMRSLYRSAYRDHLMLLGANGLAGNWGPICLPWPVEFELEARECACGLARCLNLFVSRQALSLEYQFLSEKSLSAEEVFAAAAQGISSLNQRYRYLRTDWHAVWQW